MDYSTDNHRFCEFRNSSSLLGNGLTDSETVSRCRGDTHLNFGTDMESDKRFNCTKNEILDDKQPEVLNMTKTHKEQPVPCPKVDPPKDLDDIHHVDSNGIENRLEHVAPAHKYDLGEVNMEVTVTAEELERAGGFGATDDISNLLPVASDFTDFEAHLHDVQDQEDLADKISGQLALQKDISDVCKLDLKAFENVAPSPKDGFEALYLEASATDDEVMRAGGFGATDDISSFLPVASDFTDFEAHLRNAEDYENLEKEISRPGLGWTNSTK